MSMSKLQSLSKAGDKNNMSSHLESRDTKGLHSLFADGIVIQVDACQKCSSSKLSSSKLQLVPGRRESDMEVDQG